MSDHKQHVLLVLIRAVCSTHLLFDTWKVFSTQTLYMPKLTSITGKTGLSLFQRIFVGLMFNVTANSYGHVNKVGKFI